jgi:hypothetical protein
MLREKGRDLHGEFVGLLPAPPQPVSIQRWSLRRVGLMAATAVLLVVATIFLVATSNNDDATQNLAGGPGPAL